MNLANFLYEKNAFYSDLIKIPRVLLSKESPGKKAAGIAGSII